MSVKLMAAAFAAHFHDIDFEETRQKKSGEIVSRKVRVLAPTAKWVVVALADHANDEGEGAYPSVDLLADKTDLSTVSVITALKALKHAQIITYVGLSKRKTNNYTVNREKLQAMAAQPKQIREKKGKAALPTENEQGKAALPSGVKPLYPEGKAALPESSLTVLNHPLGADAPKASHSKAEPPAIWGIGWQLGAGVEEIKLPTPEEQQEIDLVNALNLFHEHEQPYVKTFFIGTGILPVKADLAFWRKAITYLQLKGCSPDDCATAIRDMLQGGMTVTSPQSLKNTAPAVRGRRIAAAVREANTPAPELPRYLQGYKPRS